MREKKLFCGENPVRRTCVLVWYACRRGTRVSLPGTVYFLSERRARRYAAARGLYVDGWWIAKAALKSWLKGKRFLG